MPSKRFRAKLETLEKELIMGDPAIQDKKPAALAAEWNNELAKRVTRWKRLRLTFALVFTSLGAATFFRGFVSVWAVWSVPCFIAAFIAYLLYLDSRDQLRTVKSRRWNSLTPRFGRPKTGKREAPPTAAPSG